MKRSIVRTVIAIAILSVSMAAIAKDKKYQKDQDNYVCSNEDLVGEWGTTMTGTIFAATPVTIATVNRTT
ncbi:MAG TPA: hypothetical protein VMG30_14770, partial [Acidobacteriota bacterium]|nr:hypothetical protein [Acidobacteriota bacterium]